MSGGKGGSKSTDIPDWLEERTKQFIDRADKSANIGHVPYFGPDVAAMNPMEQQAARNSVSAAGAFGLGGGIDPLAGMPEAQTFAGGTRAYSAGPLFAEAVNEAQLRAPGTMNQYNELFADPAPNIEGSRYFDPNNPEHVAARLEAQEGQGQYPPGYEWLRFFDMAGGGRPPGFGGGSGGFR